MATVQVKLTYDEYEEAYKSLPTCTRNLGEYWIGGHTICHDGFIHFLKRTGDKTSNPVRIWLTLTDNRKDEDDPDWWPLQFSKYAGLYLVGKRHNPNWEVPYVVDRMMDRLEGNDRMTCTTRWWTRKANDLHGKHYWIKVEYSA